MLTTYCFRSSRKIYSVLKQCVYFGGKTGRSARAMIDKRRILVTGGRGGDGICSFKKHARRGIIGPGTPNGKDGIEGGAVLVRPTTEVRTLEHLSAVVKGKDAAEVKIPKKNKLVKSSVTEVMKVYLDVPPGTMVWELVTPPDPFDKHPVMYRKKEYSKKLIADLDSVDHAPILVSEGGEGGTGNTKKDIYNSTKGKEGSTILL
eukprot:GHVL01044578.1.p1 GENE.GHVL01044578.1~~GHVL01044578.1.p1  ORF type:complete len:204 (+),score=35.45 GHVL01044578.1:48-659(+)